jgi:hypothetical protein
MRLRGRCLLALVSLALTVGVTVAAWPLLADSLDDALERSRGARWSLFALSWLSFCAAALGSAAVWRYALNRAGASLGIVDASVRYGVGCLVNSLAPAHLGDAVRGALLVQALPPGHRHRIFGALGIVQLARLGALAVMLTGAFVGLAAAGALLVALGLGAVAMRSARIAALAVLAPSAKVLAVAGIAAALSVEDPIKCALAIVPALQLAALLALTPANLGMAVAAAAAALQSQGMSAGEAVSIGIVLHAVETAAGLSVGVMSGLVLAVSHIAPAPRLSVRPA